MATIAEVLRALVHAAPVLAGDRDDFLAAVGDFEKLFTPEPDVTSQTAPAPPG